MRIRLKICKRNAHCNECVVHLHGKQGVLLSPNGRSERLAWLLCPDCFLNIGGRVADSEGYEFVKKALQEG